VRPIVVHCDPASEVRDRLWDIQAESLDAIDVGRPLHRRFVRYWPWAFGKQKKVPIADETAALPVGLAAHADAIEENIRLLYVSMTRARDLLVLARQQKNPTGEWMDTVVLGDILPEGDGVAIGFRRAGRCRLPAGILSAKPVRASRAPPGPISRGSITSTSRRTERGSE
jgi:hypothetical protein